MNATPTSTDLTYSQAAAVLGMMQGSFSTFLKRKGFAGRRSPNHRYAKVIARPELEALIGYQITDAQIDAAKQKTARHPKQFPLLDNELNLDFGWIRFGFEIANDIWLKHLLAHGIDHIEPPPFPHELATEMASRSLFTRSEVYDLLDSCVRQRDRQWDEWVVDSVERAQFPNGPAHLEFKYPEPVEG